MPSSGPRSAGTGNNDISEGVVEWVDPTNITTSNDSHAVATNSLAAQETNNLEATQFGFTIPSDPVGIEVFIERKQSGGNPGDTIKDQELFLLVGGARVGNNKADTSTNWPTSDTVKTYGGAADLWGATPTAAQINASSFGVELVALMDCPSGVSHQAHVDHISITVHYDAAAGGGGLQSGSQTRHFRFTSFR